MKRRHVRSLRHSLSRPGKITPRGADRPSGSYRSYHQRPSKRSLSCRIAEIASVSTGAEPSASGLAKWRCRHALSFSVGRCPSIFSIRSMTGSRQPRGSRRSQGGVRAASSEDDHASIHDCCTVAEVVLFDLRNRLRHDFGNGRHISGPHATRRIVEDHQTGAFISVLLGGRAC